MFVGSIAISKFLSLALALSRALSRSLALSLALSLPLCTALCNRSRLPLRRHVHVHVRDHGRRVLCNVCCRTLYEPPVLLASSYIGEPLCLPAFGLSIGGRVLGCCPYFFQISRSTVFRNPDHRLYG